MNQDQWKLNKFYYKIRRMQLMKQEIFVLHNYKNGFKIKKYKIKSMKIQCRKV